MAVGAATGCRQQPESTVVVKEERRDVPLRIAMIGSELDAEAIERGWAAVTDQPLSIQPIDLNRAESGSLFEVVHEAAKQSDLVMYPLALVSQLTGEEAIVSISKDDFLQIEESAGKLLPSVGSGAARYAGEYFAVPLGAAIPALLSAEEIGEIDSWEDYDRLVDQQWDSMASEPSAPGWAGVMFLRRAAGIPNWLFRREDLQPVVDTDPYIDALQLMARTCSRYKSKPQAPSQVWDGIQAGELKGGIGFPVGQINSEVEVYVNNAPGMEELSKVLLDPFALVISLSSKCRQSVVAKRFMRWISGGEASESVRRHVSGMTVVRGAPARAVQGDSAGGVKNLYDDWLMSRLESPVTLPTLQILNAGEYYHCARSAGAAVSARRGNCPSSPWRSRAAVASDYGKGGHRETTSCLASCSRHASIVTRVVLRADEKTTREETRGFSVCVEQSAGYSSPDLESSVFSDVCFSAAGSFSGCFAFGWSSSKDGRSAFRLTRSFLPTSSKDRAFARIAQSRGRQTQDACVAARSIGKSFGNAYRTGSVAACFVTDQLHDPTSSGNDWGAGVGPLLPIIALPPLLPCITAALSRRFELTSFFRCWKRLLGDRDALFDQRADLFGFVQGGGDTTGHLRRIVVMACITLGQEQSAGKIFQQRFAMTRASSERAASSSVTHGIESVS